MSERPILLSGPETLALLQDQTLETRRVIKPQPPKVCTYAKPGELGWVWWDKKELWGHRWPPCSGEVRCPCGTPGDLLRVKETWRPAENWSAEGAWGEVLYRADGSRKICESAWWYRYAPKPGIQWYPSIFMPRDFSRLTVRLTAVGVEVAADLDAWVWVLGLEVVKPEKEKP